MTCIVGVVGGKRVWLGADSWLSDSGAYEVTGTGKLWRSGGYVLGAAGNSAWFTVMRRVPMPKLASEGFMCAGWAETLMAAARAMGLAFPNSDDALDGSALVAGAGALWYVDSSLECYRVPRELAIGSGGESARGALYVAKGHAKTRVTRALEAAASVRSDVGPPFVVVSV